MVCKKDPKKITFIIIIIIEKTSGPGSKAIKLRPLFLHALRSRRGKEGKKKKKYSRADTYPIIYLPTYLIEKKARMQLLLQKSIASLLESDGDTAIRSEDKFVQRGMR